MEAAGFHPGRCCRSLRLRKQSRGTRQTVPPGYGSPVSCEAVRLIHQLQPRYTHQRNPQWTLPWAQRRGTARCDVRFGRSEEPSSSTLFTQPKAAAASPRMEASGFHPDRRSDSLSSIVQVSNLHLQFAFLSKCTQQPKQSVLPVPRLHHQAGRPR